MARSPRRAAAADEKPEPKTTTDRTLSFDYIKSNLFRVIHADGAIGSITPTGNLHVAFYSERAAIPKRTVHQHFDDGSISDPLADMTESRESIVREIDVDVVFSSEVLDSLINFLQANREALAARSNPKPKKVRRDTH